MPHDRYWTFAELEASQIRGADFRTVVRRVGSEWIVVAPHGGGIEPGTSEIARAVAGHEHSLYLFEGIKGSRNDLLHITSTRFDDPTALLLVEQHRRALTIHGCSGGARLVRIGGRDAEAAEHFLDALRRNGIDARLERGTSLGGTDARNICNRNRSSSGVQLEFSQGLRRTMFTALPRSGRNAPTPLFRKTIRAIRSAMTAECASDRRISYTP